MSETVQKNSNPILKIALGVIVVLLVGTIIYRLLGVIVVALLLFINRDLVKKIFDKILQLYQTNPLYGIGATIGAFVLFSPFTVFLFFRTLYTIFTGNVPVTNKTSTDKVVIDITPKEDTQKRTPRTDGMMTMDEIRAQLRDQNDAI
jgi:hypothetical protein